MQTNKILYRHSKCICPLLKNIIFFFLDFSFFPLIFSTFFKSSSLFSSFLRLSPLKLSIPLAEIHHTHFLFHSHCHLSELLFALPGIPYPQSSVLIPTYLLTFLHLHRVLRSCLISCFQLLGQCSTFHSLPHSICPDAPTTPDLPIL